MITNCECELAGFCNRHKVHKSNLLLQKCETDISFWNAWEEGRGPGQIKRERKQVATHGVGSELEKILKEKGYSTNDVCGCKTKIRQMNCWGPKGCLKNIDRIRRWLVSAARKNNWFIRQGLNVKIFKQLIYKEIDKLILLAIEHHEEKIRTRGYPTSNS